MIEVRARACEGRRPVYAMLQVLGGLIAYMFMAVAFIGLVMPACTLLAVGTLIQDVLGIGDVTIDGRSDIYR